MATFVLRNTGMTRETAQMGGKEKGHKSLWRFYPSTVTYTTALVYGTTENPFAEPFPGKLMPSINDIANAIGPEDGTTEPEGVDGRAVFPGNIETTAITRSSYLALFAAGYDVGIE